MHIETLVPPVVDPLLLEEAKDHLRLSSTAEDAATSALIAAATGMVERRFGLALVNRTLKMTLPAPRTAEMRLPVRPLVSLSAVGLIPEPGEETTLAEDSYHFCPGLLPVITFRKPVTTPVVVTAEAGFGESWNSIPADIRQAVLLLIGHLYSHRGDARSGAWQDSGALTLLAPYRSVRL
jgi:uncharacterized phiE125 gp8 family phage protein